MSLDPEITEANAFFKFLRIRCSNWTSERLAKVSGLRFGVSLPHMDALNVILYPAECFDAPIFLAFAVLTKKRFICHLNVCTRFDEATYRATWIDPLVTEKARYAPFDSSTVYPDWMLPYRNQTSIHGTFETDRLADFTQCTFDYLDRYVAALAQATPVVDIIRQGQVRELHEGFKRDIRTRDRAQGMTARFIGKERARRIFCEVAT